MAQYREAATTGMPVMRPLFVDFWDDATAAAVDDELMFGPDYLVAPQLRQSATERNVYVFILIFFSPQFTFLSPPMLSFPLFTSLSLQFICFRLHS